MADIGQVTCATELKNTGLSKCSVDLGFVIGHILVPRDTEFATKALAQDVANWQTGIQADAGSRFYPLAPSIIQEPTPNESIYQDLSQGRQKFLYTKIGKDVFKLDSEIMTPLFLQNIESLNNGIWAVYEYTSTGFILGKSVDGVKFLPRYATVHIEQQDKGTAEAAADLPYTVQLVNDKDRTDFVAWIEPDFNPATDLEGLLDVGFVVSGSPSITELIVLATTALNGLAVTGAVLADFLVLKTNGDSQTPDSVSESPDGTYTFVDTDLATGTLNFQAPSAMTLESYEGVEVDFTVT